MTVHKSEIQSAVATTIICAIILLILFFCGITASVDNTNEGVMVALGVYDDGLGEQLPAETPAQKSVVTPENPLPTTQETQLHEENLITQDDPSVAIDAEKKKKEEQEAVERTRKLEEERQRKLEEERERERERKLEEERLKVQKLEEEKAAKEKVGSLVGNAFKQTGAGSGETKNDTQQGKPMGFGSQNGNSWSLSGRDIRGGLAQPSYSGKQEGTIVVNIRVDSEGNVTSASIAPAGTDITDGALRQASVNAAKKNKFTVGDGVAIGTITYKFSLN